MTLGHWEFYLVFVVLFIITRVAFIQSRIFYLQRIHKRWAATVSNSNDAEQLRDEDMPQFQRVLREAKIGIEDIKWPATQPTGYGFVVQREALLLHNLCYPNKEVALIANAKIGEAIGAYRMRRNDTLNPIYWFIALWNLPQSIAGSFGANKNAWPVQLIKVLYQLGVVAGLLIKAWNAWHATLRQIP